MENQIKERKLTLRQQIFVNEIAKGNTQRQACLIAYQNAKNWKTSTIDVRANALMKNEAVRNALLELSEIQRNKTIWSKENATKRILAVIDSAEEELERLRRNFNKELEIKEKMICELKEKLKKASADSECLQIKEEILKLEKEIIEHNKQIVLDDKCTNTIIQGIDILNKMYGWRNLGWENCIIEKQKNI